MPLRGFAFNGLDLNEGIYGTLTDGNMMNAQTLVDLAQGTPLSSDQKAKVNDWNSKETTKGTLADAVTNVRNAIPEDEDETEQDEGDTQGRAEGGLIEAEGYADGGEVCSHCGRKNYEDGGEVEGPGTGTSDSVKARLSDGEFVFTAKAVEQIGANNLMAVMKEAEKQYDKRTSESEARSLFGKTLRK